MLDLVVAAPLAGTQSKAAAPLAGARSKAAAAPARAAGASSPPADLDGDIVDVLVDDGLDVLLDIL